jgi:hypothetical protein
VKKLVTRIPGSTGAAARQRRLFNETGADDFEFLFLQSDAAADPNL